MITGVAGSVLLELLQELIVRGAAWNDADESLVVPEFTTRFPALGLVVARVFPHPPFVGTGMLGFAAHPGLRNWRAHTNTFTVV